MHTLRLLRLLLEITLLYGVFQLGKLMIARDRSWAHHLLRGSETSQKLENFFLYCGRTFQWLAAVWGLIDVVAILVLLTGMLTDMALGL
ncbi:MAG: hypothetical protein ACLGSD_09460 [Acidobacteriota bacterium]